MLQTQWFYKNESNGQRVGPVDHADIERLIAGDQFDRATLVWNPGLSDWARASATDLVSLFGNTPPPMPAGEVSRVAIYAVALLPVWGAVIQAVTSIALAEQLELTPRQMFEHWGWIVFVVVLNVIFALADSRSLKKAGLTVRGGRILALLLIPAYIFMSCKTIRRHSPAGQGTLAYVPFWLWLASFVAAIFVGPMIIGAY